MSDWLNDEVLVSLFDAVSKARVQFDDPDTPQLIWDSFQQIASEYRKYKNAPESRPLGLLTPYHDPALYYSHGIYRAMNKDGFAPFLSLLERYDPQTILAALVLGEAFSQHPDNNEILKLHTELVRAQTIQVASYVYRNSSRRTLMDLIRTPEVQNAFKRFRQSLIARKPRHRISARTIVERYADKYPGNLNYETFERRLADDEARDSWAESYDDPPPFDIIDVDIEKRRVTWREKGSNTEKHTSFETFKKHLRDIRRERK